MKVGAGQDRATLVFFLIDMIQRAKFPSICLSWSGLQPTVAVYDGFSEVMRLLSMGKCIFVCLCAFLGYTFTVSSK